MSYFYISSAVHNEYNLLCARGGSCLRKQRRDNLFTEELRRISKMAVFGILGQGREGRRQQAAKTINNQKTKRLEIGTGLRGALVYIGQSHYRLGDVLVDPLHSLFLWLHFSICIYYYYKLC